MSKKKLIFIVFVTICVLLVVAFILYEYFKSKPGGIRVIADPASEVYVNSEYVGKTPYKGIFPAGEIDLKIVPGVKEKGQIPYQTKVGLISGIETVVERSFSSSEQNSSGSVISFEKMGGKDAGLVIIASPDNAEIFIDGVSQGKSPYNLNTITTGKHKIIIKSMGYESKTLNLKTAKGLKLTAFVKLGKAQENIAIASPAPTVQGISNIMVIIGKTPTGFLRMRTKPGTTGEEIAELKAGEKYQFLEKDNGTGWYKIQYKDPAPGLPNGITGWISNQYSTLSSPIPASSSTAFPTASASATPSI